MVKRRTSADSLVSVQYYTKYEGQSEAGVPLPSKIPLLGELFKKNAFDNQSELLIFISPRSSPKNPRFRHRVEKRMEARAPVEKSN